MQMVFGHMMRGKTSAGMRRNRSQKVSLEHMALFRLPGESQDRYLLRELQIAAGMKHLQLLLDSVVVWGLVSLLMRHKRNSKQVIPDHHLGLCIIRMRLLFGICKDGRSSWWYMYTGIRRSLFFHYKWLFNSFCFWRRLPCIDHLYLGCSNQRPFSERTITILP